MGPACPSDRCLPLTAYSLIVQLRSKALKALIHQSPEMSKPYLVTIDQVPLTMDPTLEALPPGEPLQDLVVQPLRLIRGDLFESRVSSRREIIL